MTKRDFMYELATMAATLEGLGFTFAATVLDELEVEILSGEKELDLKD